MTTIELPAATSAQAFTPAHIRILCVLFFFSGFPALIYQLVWQRSLFRIFGVNSESVTIVVTTFMLGLGLGSLCGGWISRRSNLKPLLLLGGIELATAAFGLVSLQIFEQVGARMADLPLPALAVINRGAPSAPAASPSPTARGSSTTCWCRRRRSPGIMRAGDARWKPTASTANASSPPMTSIAPDSMN
jgi:MFS family permease